MILRSTDGLSENEIREALTKSLEGKNFKKSSFDTAGLYKNVFRRGHAHKNLL